MDPSEISELSLEEKQKEPSDFQLWKFKVNILLNSQGLYGMVCGEVKAPGQSSSDCADYLENLVIRMKVLGNDIPENMLISRILMTLPERYSYFISAWESTPMESKTMANLTTRVIAEEKRSADSRTETDVVAFKKVAVKKCYKCDSDKHLAGFHKTDAARSTCHMTYGNSLLENTSAVRTDRGLAKKSASMNANSVGRVVTDYCELKEVLYIPQLREVNFAKNEVAVIKENEVLIRGRKGASGLYVVTTTRDSIPEALVAERKQLEMTWHRRLGHISQDRMKVPSRIVEGMNLTEVPELLIRHIRKIEIQWNLKVHKLRTDDDTSAPYMHQHQGMAERFNRTLLDKVRALILDSAAPEDLWDEASYTANYLISRSPTKGQSETPAKLWYRRKHNVSNLRIFGCEAHAKINRHQLKFKSRIQKLLFVGYSGKGYQLCDAVKRKIVVRRDIVCLEGSNTRNEVNDTPIMLPVPEDEQNDSINKSQENENSELIVTEITVLDGNSDSEESLHGTATRKETHEDSVMSIDYCKTYSPVLNSGPMRDLLGMAQREGYVLRTFDIKTAFLYGYLEKPVYMYPHPPVLNSGPMRDLLGMAQREGYVLRTFDIKTAFLYGYLEKPVYMYPHPLPKE
ncbi:hypothetical protein PR048_016063 [Dryococelus australis]|uniref:Integrase catalytic domain-containing protein n=1 Tax=Dryococelus australis TaxID=614101 RepID=A0ABQ9HIP1_9NEOP|nr:hypothetical protein PR048_016063 [Dryococelus australis]